MRLQLRCFGVVAALAAMTALAAGAGVARAAGWEGTLSVNVTADNSYFHSVTTLDLTVTPADASSGGSLASGTAHHFERLVYQNECGDVIATMTAAPSLAAQGVAIVPGDGAADASVAWPDWPAGGAFPVQVVRSGNSDGVVEGQITCLPFITTEDSSWVLPPGSAGIPSHSASDQMIYGTSTSEDAGGHSTTTTTAVLRRVPCDETVDSDGDRLSDCREFDAKTNPFAPDTDGDGIPDGADPAPLVAGGGGSTSGSSGGASGGDSGTGGGGGGAGGGSGGGGAKTFSLQVRRLSARTGALTAALGSVASDPGGLTCSGDGLCTGTFAAGTTVTLRPSWGSQALVGWSGGACPSSGTTCSFTMDRDRFVDAKFFDGPQQHDPAAVFVAARSRDGKLATYSPAAGRKECQSHPSDHCVLMFDRTYTAALAAENSVPGRGQEDGVWEGVCLAVGIVEAVHDLPDTGVVHDPTQPGLCEAVSSYVGVLFGLADLRWLKSIAAAGGCGAYEFELPSLKLDAPLLTVDPHADDSLANEFDAACAAGYDQDVGRAAARAGQRVASQLRGARLRRLATRGRASVTLTAPADAVEVSLAAAAGAATAAAARARPFVLAAGRATAPRSGRVRLTLRATRRGQRALAAGRIRAATLRVAVRSDYSRATATRRVRLRAG